MDRTTLTRTRLRIQEAKSVRANLSVPELIEIAAQRQEGTLAANGAMVCKTGKYTGRTPKDKFTVKEPSTENIIWWENNNAMSEEAFERLMQKAQSAIKGKDLFVTDCYGGADPKNRINVRFVCEKAWHSLFVKQLLIRPTESELENFKPEWTIIDLCEEKCDPKHDHTNGDAVIALNFAEKTVLIMGTQYAGEMKKSVFTILNALLPQKGIMTMHCSANIGKVDGETALFFGLSGTGKTTLSADPERNLIGDDEHGWSEEGIFNFEGGCYAKCINLTRQGEPEIWDAIRFGSVLENVVVDSQRNPDYFDKSLTENTRCAYPINYIEGAAIPSVGSHPKNIFFLTCDAFGVLPPISKLTTEQAMYYFALGYTAKVAGTEAGVTEPKATFSTCFGKPFWPLRPEVYINLLKDKINQHGTKVWLVNTGWTSGPYGIGERMKLKYTRAMLHAALNHKFSSISFMQDPIFGLSIPTECPDVPSEILNPRNTWKDKALYDKQAQELLKLFEANS